MMSPTYRYSAPPAPPAPQILPWLAREAVLSDERAHALWVKACQQTSASGLKVGTPAYWKQAMNRLHALMDAESNHLDQQYALRRWTRLWRKVSTLQSTWMDAGLTVAVRLQRAIQQGRDRLTHCL